MKSYGAVYTDPVKCRVPVGGKICRIRGWIQERFAGSRHPTYSLLTNHIPEKLRHSSTKLFFSHNCSSSSAVFVYGILRVITFSQSHLNCTQTSSRGPGITVDAQLTPSLGGFFGFEADHSLYGEFDLIYFVKGESISQSYVFPCKYYP